ncbi:MAG TPA: glycosyltransferase, partial [Chthoniobacteraceae bacterium]|nr:glycosyltransferase [Chthoniobacteraceae bacterium]
AETAWISTSTFAKFLRFAPGTRAVCYMHNPTRFLWQTDEYVDHEIGNPLLNRAVRAVLPVLRKYDREAAQRMDVLVANSRNVQERIRRFYGRDSIVIHPPVQTNRFQLSTQDDGFYLIVSRLVGYKNVELAVRACSATGRRLVVIGDGPQRAALERLAGPTVRIAGRLSEEETLSHYERCRAFIFPGHEDFGITPVEAMACGKPIIALKRGGALETVLEGTTGVFFEEPTDESLLAATEQLEKGCWDGARIRAHAEQFSEECFLGKMEAILHGR